MFHIDKQSHFDVVGAASCACSTFLLFSSFHHVKTWSSACLNVATPIALQGSSAQQGGTRRATPATAGAQVACCLVSASLGGLLNECCRVHRGKIGACLQIAKLKRKDLAGAAATPAADQHPAQHLRTAPAAGSPKAAKEPASLVVRRTVRFPAVLRRYSRKTSHSLQSRSCERDDLLR